jgi:carbon storage regulator CsrA
MLVLTRKLQQQVKIGDQITVTILRVKGNTVRIGVAAPRDVRVVRGELPQMDAGEASPITGQSLATCESHAAKESSAATSDAAGGSENNEHTPAPRLPARRPFDRYGAAPLKQLVAQTVLAK